MEKTEILTLVVGMIFFKQRGAAIFFQGGHKGGYQLLPARPRRHTALVLWGLVWGAPGGCCLRSMKVKQSF